ncbi:methyltransferase family protein [Brevibacterium luteolum]|uniref:methyltransferase family protein n=1 Tax=Brevibacterium luteolum TaxID=199591 RepID=UPI003B67A821
MTSTPPRVPPVAALAASAAAQTVLGTSRPGGGARRGLACILATASAGLLASSVARFRQQRTTVNPLNPSEASSLVTSGPNAVSRNPMYVAMAGALSAHALWRGNFTSWLPVAGFVLWIDRAQIRPEEAALEAQFGQDYTRYKAHVPRWIGLPLAKI